MSAKLNSRGRAFTTTFVYRAQSVVTCVEDNAIKSGKRVNRIAVMNYKHWAALTVLMICISYLTGCSHRPAAVEGSKCYATAMPKVGEGGLAWGDTQKSARSTALANCERYASRSGGLPQTCRIVQARCK